MWVPRPASEPIPASLSKLGSASRSEAGAGVVLSLSTPASSFLSVPVRVF